MFTRILAVAIAGFVIIHGLIHLIGFRVYAQGTPVAEMPFKTTFLKGSLDLGLTGTRVYGSLWLLPTLGFILAGIGFFLHVDGWLPVMIAASLISLVLTGMDWGYAFRGTLIDLAILGATLFSSFATRTGFSF